MNTPSFYCENCSREVAAGLDVCPGCGQEFSSVRCPSCGFAGEPELFKESCPECGYSGKAKEDEDSGRNLYIVKSNNTEYRKNIRSEKQLPSWLYKILIGFMVIIIIFLVRFYFQL